MLPTIIYRHRKENKKKCTLSGLEEQKNFIFFDYPKEDLSIDFSSYIILSMEGDILTTKDAGSGLCIIDGTWRYAKIMQDCLVKKTKNISFRSLPQNFQTAYPRKQTHCIDPIKGLASIEALYIAYHILGYDKDHLLDNYYWKEKFLQINHFA